MCQTCRDKEAAMWKDHALYARPVEYAERERQGSEHGEPVIISRRLNRPRRCRSHMVKVAGKVLARVFGNFA